jgi:uncharacterized protein (DUF362 family)
MSMSRHILTRRRFMRLAATSATAAGPLARLAGTMGPAAKGGDPSPPLQVALVPCPDYGPDHLATAIRAGWGSSQAPDVRGKRVVIKPNMVDVSSERPIHTDPRLVEALILHLQGAGAAEVVLAEGTSHNRDAEDLFRRAGYEALAKRRAVRLVDLNYDDFRRIENVNPRAALLKEIAVPETIAAADVVISVPKLKTHKLAGITLSLKNMFGVLPGMIYGWPKNTLHWNGIPQSICEINGTIPAHYAVVDGVTGMEGHGPIMGKARQVGVLIMGANGLAVDATAARVMGVEPSRVEYLALAHRLRLGSLRRDDIDVRGEPIARVRVDFALDAEYRSLRAPKEPT